MEFLIEKYNLGLYILLFGLSILVNKYVLSVLNFIYPTIFQGWQTLVGGILLKVLLVQKYFSVSTTALDRSGFVSLLPSFLFFTAGIVASSKALAGLNIPIYLCLQNTVNAFLCLLRITPVFKECITPTAITASLITIASSIAAVFYEIEMTFADSPYFWMIVYLACLCVQTLHSKIADARYCEIDCLYFCYIFSVIILAPASLYLEEAFEVLKFPNASRYDFYVGCLLSGILGLFLNLFLFKVRQVNHFSVVDGVGKITLSIISVFCFTDSISLVVQILVLVNFVSSIFVPLPKNSNQQKESYLESNEPLLIEET